MRILIVDDHPLFRAGLRTILENDSSLEVVGEAGDGSEAMALIKQLLPDIVVMDIVMPEQNGLAVAKEINKNYPQIKIIILSGFPEHGYVEQALRAGAIGFVYKSAAFDEVSAAIKAIEQGKPYLSPTVLQPVINGYLRSKTGQGAVASFNNLTKREQETLLLLGKGYKRRVIAEKLGLKPKTVDRYKGNIKTKLNLCSEEEIRNFLKLAGISNP